MQIAQLPPGGGPVMLRKSFNRFAQIFIILLSSLSLISQLGHAAMPEKLYRSQLQFANEWATKKKVESSDQSQALSSQLITRLFGRYYQVGDHWTVAAWQIEHGMMRMTSEANQTQSQVGRGGLFKYEVIQVKNGSHPEVTIRVVPLEGLGFEKVDPKVQYLDLKMDDAWVQSEKTYTLAGRSQPEKASPNGIHSQISTLELYPLDPPEVSFSNSNPARNPSLPPVILKFAQASNWKLNLSRSFQFDQDDFFGRPIELIWEEGMPWPSYIKTNNGVALLLDRSSE